MNKYLKKVRAVLNPSQNHIETFKNEYKQFIGKEFIFQYCWIMDDDETFPGVWALCPRPNEEEFICSWVPEFDLDIIEEVKK